MKRTILIVEDDYQIRTSLDKSFRRRGHELFCAGELAEARAVLRERKIDLSVSHRCYKLYIGSGLCCFRFSDEPNVRIRIKGDHADAWALGFDQDRHARCPSADIDNGFPIFGCERRK